MNRFQGWPRQAPQRVRPWRIKSKPRVQAWPKKVRRRPTAYPWDQQLFDEFLRKQAKKPHDASIDHCMCGKCQDRRQHEHDARRDQQRLIREAVAAEDRERAKRARKQKQALIASQKLRPLELD